LANIAPESQLTRKSGLIETIAIKQDWNQTLLNKSYEIMLNAKQKLECYWIKTVNDQDIDEPIGYPNVDQIYKPMVKKCISSEDSNNITSHAFVVTIISLIAIIIAIIIAFGLHYMYKRRAPVINRNRLIEFNNL